jgi:hypothetical protein
VTAVRYQGIIHGFVVLDALREPRAAVSATCLAADALYTSPHLPAASLDPGGRRHWLGEIP